MLTLQSQSIESFKDLTVKDLLFDADCSMKFTYTDNLKKETDARLRFIKKSDRIDTHRMGVDVYDRDMCIFGNKFAFMYSYDRFSYIKTVKVTGVKVNAQMQGNKDEFLDLINMLVEFQASGPQRNVAVLMGCNPRLGQNSCLSTLDEDIIRHIIETGEAEAETNGTAEADETVEEDETSEEDEW